VAAGASLCFLISVWNVPLDSKVSSFALLLVVGGLAVAQAVPAGARRMSVGGLAVLVASYARPELHPAATVRVVAALWLSYREARAGDRRAVRWSIAASIAILAPYAWTGTPTSARHDGVDRLLQALQEHFAWNWNRWHDAHASALSIWRQEFGAADGPLTAVLANPRSVARHLADNTVGTLRLIGGSTFDHFPLLAPPTWPRAVTAENVFLGAVAFGAVVVTIARPEHRRALRDRYGTALFQYAVLTAVCVMAMAIVFPVPRYVTMPCVLALLTAALATSLLVPTSRRFAAGTRVAIALVCLAAVPRPFVVPSTYAVAGPPFPGRITVLRRVADTVAFVRALGLPRPVRVLSTTGGIGVLLGEGFEQVDVWGMGAQPLEAYMRTHDVGLVINLEGGRQSLAVDDPTWARLQLQPKDVGFTGVPVPGHEAVGVFVRNDLVARAGAR
jgi:hypothetical protein